MGRLNAAYLERKLRSAVGLVGGEQLQELKDVAGLLVLENDRPEWGVPGGEFRFATSQLDAGGAGLRYVALVNPFNSGSLVIVQKAIKTVTGATELWGVNPVTATAAPFLAGQLAGQSGISRDTRVANVSTAVTITGSNAATIAANVFHVATVLDTATPNLTTEPLIILFPGWALIHECQTAATILRYSHFWRERPVEGRFDIK